MLSQELKNRVEKVDVLIVGAGPAGMAAAIAAKEAGVDNLLVLEREANMGGILRQCIHNGFGLHRFKEELTGPEYAQRDIDKVKELGIEVRCGTTVLSIDENRFVTAVSREKGVQLFEAGALILAMGCRERPRGALATPGTRCAGIYLRRYGSEIRQSGRLYARQAGGHSGQRRYRPDHGPPHDPAGCQGAGLRGTDALFQRPEPQYRPVPARL